MKKIICLFLLVLMFLVLCGCKGKHTSDFGASSATFSQSMTISEMSIPVKFKTTNKASSINEVLDVLENIQKEEKVKKNTGTYKYVIKITIDSNSISYMIGEKIFMDASGIKYKIKNADEIIEKIIQIYNEIDADEVSDG